MSSRYRSAAVGAALFFFFVGTVETLFAQSPPTFVRGVITTLGRTALTITGADGAPKTVTIGADTLVLQLEPATLASLASGETLGVTASRGSDGSLTATAINIFSPEVWRRVPGGQFPMGGGLIMTNAPVTNYEADPSGGGVLTMSYGGGSFTIAVTAKTAVHKLVASSLSSLGMGTFVIVRGTTESDGTVLAGAITYNPSGR